LPRKLLILLFIGLPWSLPAQPIRSVLQSRPQYVAVFLLKVSDTVFTLPHTYLLQGSERVVIDSLQLLVNGKDYQFQIIPGTISVHKGLILRALADSGGHTITVSYERLPFSLATEYALHEPIHRADSMAASQPRTGPPPRSFSAEDVFGQGLQRSGSIIRGISVGSNRDLTLNSGFRLQLSGKVTSGLDLVAALTDENVPIQPEGTTQTLQELDKVFVQLTNPSYGATLGDFVYEVNERDGGEFGRFSRKLQGATGNVGLKNVLGAGSALDIAITGATTRGKYTTNQFQGVEGNQGPYRLNGEETSRRPIIIAGTERVYVNGQLMTRGETNDYTIDYSTGEVCFSPRRIVTNATRITVDFQYTDRQFVRNLVGAAARIAVLDNKLTVTTSLTQEADDAQSPIEFALDDSLRSIIATSGRNRFLASVAGTRYLGRDSVTQSAIGQYILKDTLLAGRRRPLLVYAPGDPGALYSSVFSHVDQMPADSLGYQKTAVGGFAVAGLGKGSYLPLQFLPVPELRRTASGRAAYQPRSDLTVAAEYALSEQNMNRFAPEGNASTSGGAYKLQLQYRPKGLAIGGLTLGDLELRISDRYVDQRFISLDRFNEIEFDRAWNIETTEAGNEELREIAFSLRPHRQVQLEADYGSLERKGSVNSSRWTFQGSFADSSRSKASFSSEIVRTENYPSANRSTWIRQAGNLSYQVGNVQPAVRFAMEDRQEQLTSSNSLSRGSFRFVEIAPAVVLLRMEPLAASAEVQFRTEDSAALGALGRAFKAVTQLYDVRLQEWNSLSTTVALSLRKTEMSPEFSRNGNASTNTILVRSQTRYAPLRRAVDLDALYEFARERSAPMKRVFIRVPKGTGNYLYRGDTNHNGLPDESEFEQTRFDGDYAAIFVTDDQLVPVSDVKVGLRVRLAPARWVSQPKSALEKVLTALSAETVVRIEERGTGADPADLYLVRLTRFLNDSTTISGAQIFTQDLYLFESDPSFSMRLRFNERRGLLRLIGNSERGYGRERSLRVRSQLLKEIGNQTEFINKIDQLLTSIVSPRQRNLSSDELRTEFSYRPYSEWEIAFGIALSQVTNRITGGEMEANLNEQFARLAYSLLDGGQLRSEIQREEAWVATGPGSLLAEYPFEFTNGRAIGKTYQWRLAFDYRISQYVQLSVGYDGRSEGGRAAVHTGRVEARAFF